MLITPAFADNGSEAGDTPLTLTSGQEIGFRIPQPTHGAAKAPLQMEITPTPPPDLFVTFDTKSPDGQITVKASALERTDSNSPDPVRWVGIIAVYDATGRHLGERRLIMMHEPHETADAPRSGWSRRAWWWFLSHVVLFSALVIGGYSVVRRRPWWWKRRLPHARLVPLDNRTRRVTPPIDIRSHCVKHNRLRLLIGMDVHCDVQLTHDDMQQRHMWLTMLPDRKGSARTRLIPIGNAAITVNGELVEKPRTLRDGDEVTFGALRFVFQLAEHYRPVVVEYRDGSQATGFPLSWDTLHPDFRFRDSSAAVSEGGRAIPFSKVRAVHFVADWDENVRATLPTTVPYPRGKRALLNYEDGSRSQGWLTPDYEPSAKRFHFLPEPPEGVIVSLVEREAIQNVTLLESDSA